MNEEKIRFYQEKINALGDWYQPISFIPGKLETPSKYGHKSTLHGIKKWQFILRRNLPDNLEGKKILDIGCASGLYSMLCVRAGAEVVGLELSDNGYQQALLTREIFSELDGKDYSQKFNVLKVDLMKFPWEEYQKFDIVMALNVLYWIITPWMFISPEDKSEYKTSELEKLIKQIKVHSKTFIVQADENKYWERLKKGGSTEATDTKRVVELLQSCGYTNIKVDKPVSLASLWRMLSHGTAEVDLRKPFYYARPIIKAES